MALVVVAMAVVPSALAHAGDLGGAVETRLEIPTWLVWAAGGFVVAVSFAIVGGYLSRGETSRYGLADARGIRTHRAARTGLTPFRALGLLVLALVVLPAFWRGSDSVLPETALWLGVVGLFPLLAYTLGDLWRVVSPFEALRRFTETLRGGRDPAPYPRALAAWPAVVFLLLLVAIEVAPVAWTGRPGTLALGVLGYTLVTIVGMARYGADAWLAEAEVVTRMMRWWRAASPLEWHGGRLRWRGFVSGPEALPAHTTSDVAFTVALLFGVNFDAFLATHAGDAALFFLRGMLGTFGATVLLVLVGFGLFLLAWRYAVGQVRRRARHLGPVAPLAARFVAVLLPIAVAYHFAHNAFTLVEGLPRFALAVLDPLGLPDWPEATLSLPARLALPASLGPALAAVQVLVILAGHVVAVLVAHRLAFGAFPSRAQAVTSEVPLTAIMVVYTTLGLWLLASVGGAA